MGCVLTNGYYVISKPIGTCARFNEACRQRGHGGGQGALAQEVEARVPANSGAAEDRVGARGGGRDARRVLARPVSARLFQGLPERSAGAAALARQEQIPAAQARHRAPAVRPARVHQGHRHHGDARGGPGEGTCPAPLFIAQLDFGIMVILIPRPLIYPTQFIQIEIVYSLTVTASVCIGPAGRQEINEGAHARADATEDGQNRHRLPKAARRVLQVPDEAAPDLLRRPLLRGACSLFDVLVSRNLSWRVESRSTWNV